MTGAEQGANDLPRRKRTITEARREQNRVAQRLFRQRQKEHRQTVCAKIKPLSAKMVELRPRPADDVEHTTGITKSGLCEAACSAAGPFASNRDSLPVVLPTTSVPPITIDNPSTPTLTALENPSALPNRISEVDIAISILSDHVEPIDASAVPSDKSQTFMAGDYRHSLRSPAVSAMNKPPAQASCGLYGFADPHANAIEFAQTTIFSAVLQNALCLGLDLSQLADCISNYTSPFYRPDARPQDDPAKLLKLCAASLSLPTGVSHIAMPANLRPTLTQFLVPHHISFDLIPIPLLRERAIMLSVSMPHIFNVDELKIDIYQNRGLMVWKYCGIGSRGGGTCQPWDMKSWEAAPWFLKKWSMAVGGNNGELSKQSSSWQSLRRSQLLWSQLLQK